MSEKVIAFPNFRSAQLNDEPQQLSLFREADELSNYFSFTNINDYDQWGFFEILARNSVSTVVDIRSVPVFPQPNFDHVNVVEYMCSKEIIYFEYVMAKVFKEDFSDYKIARTVNSGRKSGLTLCIYDQGCLESGLVSDIRAKFNKSSLFSVEISPRSLMAAPR